MSGNLRSKARQAYQILMGRVDLDVLRHEVRKQGGHIKELKKRIQRHKFEHSRQVEKITQLRKRISQNRETLVKVRKTVWQNYLDLTFDFADRILEQHGTQSTDLVFIHDHLALEAGFDLASQSRAKTIYDAVEIPLLEHRSGPFVDQYRAFPRGLRVVSDHEAPLIARADAITTISGSLSQWLQDQYGIEDSKFRTLRNCRYFETYEANDQIRRDCNLSDEDQLVLFLNTVYQGQGFEELAAAVSELPGNVHLATLGNVQKGPYREELEALLERLDIAFRVHFLETKPPGEMIRYAAGADVSAVPRLNTSLNNYISLPNRIFESIAAGLPLATSSLPEFRNLVETYELGAVFDETDKKDIAAKLQYLLDPANRRHLTENTLKAARELCWEQEQNQVLRTISDLGLEIDGLRVSIVANKSLKSNNRIYRITRTLCENGCKIQVFSREMPHEILQLSSVKYYELPLKK